MASKKEYEVGYGKPPKNRQFGQPEGNPRRKGVWDITQTPRYWLESMIKLEEDELEKIYNNTSNPLFKRKLAKCIKDGEWKEIREMIQEVYGKVPEVQISMEADDEVKDEANKIIKGFILP